MLFIMDERAISFITTMRLPILQLMCRLFWQTITSPRSVSPPTAQVWLPATSGFSQTKVVFEREEICECDGHTVHKLSRRRLTADWLAPRQNDCSVMNSKVSSDWLPSYIKATQPVLEMFKMDWYFPDSPRVCVCVCVYVCMHVCVWTELYIVTARSSILHFYLTTVVVFTILVNHVRILQFITE